MRLFRVRFAALVPLLCVLAIGCGEKKQATTPPPAPGAAPAAGPVQGKITTGADPDKAPSYPNMYGKPAGSQ
jgi:hypothetical protein